MVTDSRAPSQAVAVVVMAFVMTPAIQRRCAALIALHALHFSGHAAVQITQEQLLYNLLEKQIVAADPAKAADSEALAKLVNTQASRVLALVVALGPGLGALLISPVVGGLADAYGRRWMALVAPLGLALTRLNLAARPSVKAFVAYRILMGPLGILMGRSIILSRADLVPRHTLHFAREIARQAQANLIVGLATSRIGQWLASRKETVGTERALADSFYLAAAVNVAAFVAAIFVMKETLPPGPLRTPFSYKSSNPLSFIAFFRRSRLLTRLALFTALVQLCHQQSYEGLFQMRQYGWGVAERTRHLMWHKVVQFFNCKMQHLARRLSLLSKKLRVQFTRSRCSGGGSGS